MPRPKSKPELLELSQKNFQKLNDFIAGFSESEQNAEFPPGTLNRNIRDVLAHLHEWHLMFLKWYEVGMKDEKPNMPAKGYTWKMTSALNQKNCEKYQNTSLSEVRQLFEKSHEKVRILIEKHTNNELFEKKRYIWTGSTSLGAYLISATSSHYDWAYKLIKKSQKTKLIPQPNYPSLHNGTE